MDTSGRMTQTPAWHDRLAERLPLLGHRNWVVLADSAYPACSRGGIETTYVGGDLLEAVATVLGMIDDAPHVRAVIYLDAELRHVREEDAPGVGAFRDRLDALLDGRPVRHVLHEELIRRFDEVAKTFHIPILKTDMAIPYTSVHIELDCGYWTAEKEQRLRQSIDGDGQ